MELSSSDRMRRLRLVSTGLLVAVIVFGLFWSWQSLSRIIPIVFTDVIYQFGYVEDDADVTVTMRALFGAMWFVTICAGWVATFFAVQLLWQFRKGFYFRSITARTIKRFGLGLAATAIFDTIFAAFGYSVLTWGNAPLDAGRAGSVGYIAPSYFYDPGDITMLLCGLTFCLIGWVLQEAEHIEAENRSFV